MPATKHSSIETQYDESCTPKTRTDYRPRHREYFCVVTEKEGSVPNHFYFELNFPEFFTAKIGATKVLWEMD